MAHVVYNYFKKAVMQGSFNLDATPPIYVCLATNSYVPDPDNHVYRTAISSTAGNEVAGTSYTAGGVALSSPNVQQDDALNVGVLNATAILWTPATFSSCLYAVLYGSTAVGVAGDPLICAVDLGTDPATGNYWAAVAGTFQITWAATGILALT
jgi:hypothetical protein